MSKETNPMNISGILVVVPPDRMDPTVDALNALAGVSVHYRDDGTGRIVVTQEAESTAAEVAGLERIQALPHVIFAELVYHYVGDGADRSAGESGSA